MKIEIKAGDSEESIAIIESAETMGGAKCRAHYLASETYARCAETSERFAFVGIYRNGILVFEVSK